MSEEVWCRSNDVDEMFRLLAPMAYQRQSSGRRKLRLFGCACCRRIMQSMTKRGLRWLDMSEKYADGNLRKVEQREADNLNLQPRNWGQRRGRADSAAF